MGRHHLAIRIRRIIAAGWLRYWILGFVILTTIAACQFPKASQSPDQPLASVAALATPKLPNWIAEISPKDSGDARSQIRIRFTDPLVPLEALDSPNQQDLLRRFEIQPALPGQFRLLTPRMVGFQADRAIPTATRVQVTLKSGLSDLANHSLSQDLAWTFTTDRLALVNLPAIGDNPSEVTPVSLKPSLDLTANTELDLGSVTASLSAGQTKVPLTIAPKKLDSAEADVTVSAAPSDPETQFDPSAKTWAYSLTPSQTLAPATKYQLTIEPGLKPRRGNLASEKPFSGAIQTYEALTFKGISYSGKPDGGGTYGRFQNGAGELSFNNGLKAESALQQITIAPAPKVTDIPVLRINDGDRTIGLNPWVLDPNVQYRITLGKDLEDRFGQRLGTEQTIDYNPGDVAPDLWAPIGLNVFPTGTDLNLNLTAINLPEAEYKGSYRVLQPTDLINLNEDNLDAVQAGQSPLLPDVKTWKTIALPNSKRNQVSEIAVPIAEKLGSKTGLLAYGFTGKTYSYQDGEGKNFDRTPEFRGLVQLTNIGVFSQWFPDSGFVRVHHLNDGSPIANAPVSVYRLPIYSDQNNAMTDVGKGTCAEGKTDATGMLQLDAAALKTCMTGDRFTEAPSLLTVVREANDWAYSRSRPWSGSYGYGIYAGWTDRTESRGEIFSDRKLYKPGETAWFTGVAVQLDRGQLRQDKEKAYKITVINPNGDRTDLGNQTTTKFGTFSLNWPIASDQPLGTYRLEAQPIEGPESSRIRGEFRVAEFKPPNFKVDLKLDKTSAKPGDQITAQAQSNYLFGPAIDGGKIRYIVTREKADLTLEDWQGFSIGRQWFWPEEEPTVPSDVSQTSLSLDAQGQASQAIAIAKDLPYPMTYRIDAEVSDISNLAVSQSQTLTALPSDRLIGLKVPFVGNAKEPVSLQVIVTDPDGKAIANQDVHIDLQRMDYSSVTQVIEGSQTNKPQVTYKSLAQAQVRSASQPQTVTITPPEAGSYRLRASLGSSAATPETEASATDSQLWVSGGNGVDWGDRYERDRLQVQLDKQTYNPGDTAHVILQSPYPEADLYLAVVRQGIITKTLTKVQGAAPQIDVPITAEMGPNAAIEAILIRQGPSLDQTKLPELDALVKIGFAPFKLNLDRQYLKVQVSPTQAELGPNQTALIDLSVSDSQGKPVASQITLIAVNEAVLQLTGHRPPDLVKTVYAEQPIALRFSDNRSQVVLKPLSSPIDKGWGYGGGLSSGLGNNRIRKDFKPLAYYGTLATDAQGKIQARIALPDDLTTWRILAVATDGNLHFGNGEATVITRQPLMVSPLLPQFLRVGDRIEAGISVTNTTGQSGQMAIDGTVDAGLSSDNPLSLQSQAPGNTEAYRFPLTAKTPGTATLRFGAQLNQDQDRIEIPLDIKALTSTEQVIETGATDKPIDLPINLSDKADPTIGGLEVSLASSPIPSLKAPIRDSFNSDWPFLETASSQLRIAADLQRLSAVDRQSLAEFEPKAQAKQALTQLKALQKSDGGFAIVEGVDESDPRLTAYAAEAIGSAQAAPFPVDQIRLDALKTYLQKSLANPASHSFCKEQPCINQLRLASLIGLDALGDRRGDFLSDLYAQREELDSIDQIRLAHYLSQFADWRAEAKAMTEQVRKTINDRARSAKINQPTNQRWLNSPTTAQAEAIQLLTVQKGSPAEIARLVQGLLDLRSNGSWGGSYDNAQALSALATVSQGSAKSNFTATASLNKQQLLTGQFKGDSATVTTTIPIDKLPKGKQTLRVQKTGSGVLHYLAAYRYRPIDNPAGRFNGLRVSRSIQLVDQATSKEKLEPIARMDLSPVKDDLEVKAGQVLEVTVELVTDHPIDHLLLTDPLPAGFEAIDPGIKTTAANEAQSVPWQLRMPLIYADRVTTWGEHLETGIYQLKYLVRSVTPGSYLYPGVEAKLQYAAEEFGRSASARINVSGS
jgi:alpha-2-macroglobulin